MEDIKQFDVKNGEVSEKPSFIKDIGKMPDNLNEPMIQQKEGIKLIKNSKGYNWEIKILDLDVSKLEELDKDLRNKFGEKN